MKAIQCVFPKLHCPVVRDNINMVREVLFELFEDYSTQAYANYGKNGVRHNVRNAFGGSEEP